MILKLNGDSYQSKSESLTVASLLNEMEIKAPRVAVELNMKIIPKAEYEQTSLADGDVIEVVGFVGGG